jgi:hypothetical protein
VNITMRDGRKFSGTPLQVVQSMRSTSFDRKDVTIDEYVHWVVDNVQRNDDLVLNVTGTCDEELCARLLNELIRTGLAT